MWYEIIPTYAIITTVLAVPTFATYFLNKGFLGNAYRREMRWAWDRQLYKRDRRLVGDPYHSPGLEAVPDK